MSLRWLNKVLQMFKSRDLESTAIDHLETLTPDELGQLLIDEALKFSRDLGYIQDLLDVGCPVDSRTSSGHTALHIASWIGNLETLKFLVSKGADIHARADGGWTPLHMAASSSNIKIVKFLISKGADINIKDEYGWTILHWAARCGHIGIIELLKYNIPRTGIYAHSKYLGTIIQCLVKFIHSLKIMKFQIYRGVDIYSITEDSKTPWDLAPYTIREAFPELRPK